MFQSLTQSLKRFSITKVDFLLLQWIRHALLENHMGPYLENMVYFINGSSMWKKFSMYNTMIIEENSKQDLNFEATLRDSLGLCLYLDHHFEYY